MNDRTNFDITGSMNGMMHSFESMFDQTCSRHILRKKIDRINTAYASERVFAIRDLEETLEKNHINTKIIVSTEGKVENANELIDLFPSLETLETQMYRRLSEMYVYFPGTKVFIKRLVNRLGNQEFQNGSTRLRILKQFLEYIRKSVYSIKKIRTLIKDSFTEEEAASFRQLKSEADKRHFYALSVKESIFAALDDPVSFGLKKDDVKLLYIRDNFARGRILNQGNTRRAVFEFGIVFGMTSYNVGDPVYSSDLDIEKNLFFDFCMNGYIDSLRERGEQAGGDIANDMLTVEGINYKNYAEVIYLYAMNHPSMPREDKIKFAIDLIKECSSLYRKTDAYEGEEQETQFYRGNTYATLFSKDGYAIAISDLPSYICRNYPLTDQNSSVSPIMQAAEQESARKEYLLLCDAYEEELQLYDRSLSDLEYTLGIFSDSKEGPDYCEYPFPEDLKTILLNFDRELKRHAERRNDIFRGYREKEEKSGKIRRDHVIVRRMDFLVLYYEYFIAVHEDDNETTVLMLEDVFRSFADHLNPVFEKSRYAPVSAKSMPDVILILFAYNMVTLLS